MNSTSPNYEDTKLTNSEMDKSSGIWYKNQLYSGPLEQNASAALEQTVITTASLVLNDYQESSQESSNLRLNINMENQLSDYENNPTTCPPQGILSKSSSASSSSSFNIRSFNRSAHSLSSTSLSSVSFPLFQPIEYAPNTHYSFYTSDCEDHSDYVPSNFSRSLHGHQATPSPLISRPSSPLPPTPSPNFSRSPSPNRALRKFKNNFMPIMSNSNSALNSPKYTRSLNGSRETSPLRLRPSSYTRPLSPNPPTVSPSLATNILPFNQLQSTRTLRSQPSSPQSQPRSPFFHQAINPNQSSQSRSGISPLGSRSNLSLRSPPSPTRPCPSGSSSPQRVPYSPVTSRPPSPLNSRQHALHLPSVRPARSQSQPPGSHRLHSRTRSTRTPSPRPPRLPSSANSHNPHPPPPPPPTSPLPNPGKRHSRMRAR